MKNPSDIILELESDNSRLFKESVLIREMENGNVDFFEGVKYCCDKLITFGVNEKTVPKVSNSFEDKISFSEFVDVLNRLSERKITGNSAKDLLQYICENTSKNTWEKWYRRILLKDLKCGVSEKTINNCAKASKKSKYAIPVFSCQLAFDSNLHENKLIGEKLVDCKLDGSRILTIVYPSGRVDQFSRNGKEIVNFSLIKDQFKCVVETLDEPMVFDGEMMSSSFQDLMTQFYRKESVDTKDSILYLFDMIPLVDFKKGKYNVKQVNRVERLHAWYKSNEHLLSNVNVLDYKIINLSDEYGREKYEEINKKALKEGYEGIMIKDPNAPYECKRSTAWLKRKPVFSMDLSIVDMEEGNDKYKGMLGALVCTGVEEGKEILVNVGSGLTDEERMRYWENKSEVVGKIAEIAYDAITKNLLGSYSLRFPRFVRLRGFEKGEKI